jgi:RimJ/RimL family protein N-acetyltransferase
MSSDLSGWKPRPHVTNAPMSGRYVELRPLDPQAHADALWAAFGTREDLWTYIPIGPFADRAALEAGLEWIVAQPSWDSFAIFDAATGAGCGTASYLRTDTANGCTEVGCIVYGERFQRTRGATEAQYLFARRVFDELGYRRYEWKCNGLNKASKRAAARLGFSYEGTFRQHMVVKGQNRDTAWFSMLDHEWPAIKARFEAWLDPANFDTQGRQKKSLSDFQEGRS